MQSNIELILEAKAEEYDREAEATNDKFNKGYFEGKAEQARCTSLAIAYMTRGNKQAALDALNGDL